MSHPAAPYLMAGVAVITLALFLVAFGAWRRIRRDALLWLVAAFGLFFLKAVIMTYSLAREWIDHENLELVGAGFDLAIAGLLVAPLLRRRG